MSTTPTRKGPSPFAKYFFVMLLGLAIGAFGAVYALNALNNPQKQVQHGVMSLLSWNMGQLKKNAQTAQCTPNDTLKRIQSMKVLAADLENTFPSLADDAAFVKSATGLRTAIGNVEAAPPLTCEGITQANQSIGEACSDCHSKFKD